MTIAKRAEDIGMSRSMFHRYLRAGVPIDEVGATRLTNRERLVRALIAGGFRERLSVDIDTNNIFLDGVRIDEGGRSVHVALTGGGYPSQLPGIGMRVSHSMLLAAMLNDSRFQSFRSTQDALRSLRWDGVERLKGGANLFFGPGNDENDSFFLDVVERVMNPGGELRQLYSIEGEWIFAIRSINSPTGAMGFAVSPDWKELMNYTFRGGLVGSFGKVFDRVSKATIQKNVDFLKRGRGGTAEKYSFDIALTPIILTNGEYDIDFTEFGAKHITAEDKWYSDNLAQQLLAEAVKVGGYND